MFGPLLAALVRGAASVRGAAVAAGGAVKKRIPKLIGAAQRARQVIEVRNQGEKAGSFMPRRPEWVERILNRISGEDQQRKLPDSSAARQPGLSPSQLMSMMGNSPEEIDAAQQEARQQQENEEIGRKAREETERLTERFKSLAKTSLGLSVAMLLLPKILFKWTESLVESRRELSRYNGSLAAAFAQLDITRFRLSVQTASATSGSGTKLVQSFQRLLEEVQPLREKATTLINIVGIGTAHLATVQVQSMDIATRMSAVLQLLQRFEQMLGRSAAQPRGQEMLDMLRNPAAHGLPATAPRDPLPPIL